MNSTQPWQGAERRKRPTPPVSRFLFRGKRVRPGAHGDENTYIDRPPREAWLSALLLLCLSALDALFSLKLFEEPHFQELNPLLLLGLKHGGGVFLLMKLGVTIVAVFVLLLHWHFVIARRRVRVIWLFRMLIAAYLLIVVYELALLAHT